MELEFKDKIETLKSLAQTHRELFAERVKIEYRIIFTTLTFFVLCIAGKYEFEIELVGTVLDIVIWVFFISLASVVTIYLNRLCFSNDLNLKIAENAENTIGKILDGTPPDKLTPFEKDKDEEEKEYRWYKLFDNKTWTWQLFKFLIIFFFAIVASYLISIK